MPGIVEELTSRRLVLVMGKGGVGKTTIAAALARDAAARGRRVGLFEISHTEALAPIFGHKPVGDQETEVAERLVIANLDARRCFERYVTRTIKSKMLYSLIFRNKVVDTFIDAIPGLDHLLMLGELVHAADPQGEPRFDLVILDAPATGHGLTLLNTPRALMDMLRVGPLFKLAQEVFARLGDSSFASLNVVTLGEEMPVAETIELFGKVDSGLNIHRSPILVNMVTETALAPDALDALRLGLQGQPSGELVLTALGGLLEQARVNRESVALLRATLGLPVVTIPQIPALGRRDLGLAALEEVACRLRNSSV